MQKNNKKIKIKAEKLLSVILPLYNQAEFLDECLASLYDQKNFSWQNSEIILMNDGSDDNPEKILIKWQKKLPLIIINHQENLGLIKSLNKALKITQGKYIARMDADDIACDDRLITQINYLEKNPEVDLLGGEILEFKTINNQNCSNLSINKKNCSNKIKNSISFENQFTNQKTQIINKSVLPSSNQEIKKHLFFYCPLMHPTLMWRQTWQKRTNFSYPEKIKLADQSFSHLSSCEDYSTWIYYANKTCFANLNKILIYHRCHNQQTSHLHKKKQVQLTYQLAKNYRKENKKVGRIKKIISNSTFLPLSWRLFFYK